MVQKLPNESDALRDSIAGSHTDSSRTRVEPVCNFANKSSQSTCIKACCQVKEKHHAVGMYGRRQLGWREAGTHGYEDNLWE